MTGDGEKVTGIRIKDRITNEERDYPWTVSSYKSVWQPTAHLSGTHWKRHRPVKSRQTHSAAPRFRVFMQPETCPNVPYKQIIIAMGEGAKAALSAFDDRIRGIA